jgi:hypothetical protein
MEDYNGKHTAPPAPPEIDPDLADLEAEAKGKSQARTFMERVLANLARKGKGKPSQGPVGKAKHGPQPNEDRWKRRQLARYGTNPDPKKTAHGRLGRAKATERKRPSQIQYQFKEEARKALSRIRVTRLLADCPDMKYVASVPGLGNVWQLSQASTPTIHEIAGLGPKRRKAIHDYLASKNVPCKWVP